MICISVLTQRGTWKPMVSEPFLHVCIFQDIAKYRHKIKITQMIVDDTTVQARSIFLPEEATLMTGQLQYHIEADRFLIRRPNYFAATV
jgi:hypothetical protein